MKYIPALCFSLAVWWMLYCVYTMSRENSLVCGVPLSAILVVAGMSIWEKTAKEE